MHSCIPFLGCDFSLLLPTQAAGRRWDEKAANKQKASRDALEKEIDELTREMRDLAMLPNEEGDCVPSAYAVLSVAVKRPRLHYSAMGGGDKGSRPLTRAEGVKLANFPKVLVLPS